MITPEKGTKKSIYYLNTNNVKRLLQELISIRNAYKMVFFGRGVVSLAVVFVWSHNERRRSVA